MVLVGAYTSHGMSAQRKSHHSAPLFALIYTSVIHVERLNPGGKARKYIRWVVNTPDPIPIQQVSTTEY